MQKFIIQSDLDFNTVFRITLYSRMILNRVQPDEKSLQIRLDNVSPNQNGILCANDSRNEVPKLRVLKNFSLFEIILD